MMIFNDVLKRSGDERLKYVLGVSAIGYWYYTNRKSFIVKGKTILVTGSSQGIGREVSKQLACELGARVVCVARSEEKLKTLVKEIKISGGEAVAIICDCSDEDAVKKYCSEEIAKATAIIHCAGAGCWRFLSEAPASDIRFCMSAPFFSAAFLTRLALPRMITKDESCSILFVQSPAGIVGIAGATSYSCARWALQGLFENTAMDCAVVGAANKIKAQLVVLGETDSNYFQNNPNSNQRIPLIAKALIKPVLSSQTAARVVVHALLTRRRTTYAPFMLQLFVHINHLMPSVVRFLIRCTSTAKIDDVVNLVH